MRKRYWLGIAVSAVLCYALFRSVELAEVARALRDANLLYLLPAVLIYFLGVLVRTVRWAVLLRPVRRLGIGRLFAVLVVGFMANNILPLRAGEGVRAFLLWRRERLEPGATLATIVVERIFDGLALTGFLVLVGILVPLDGWLTQLSWGAAIVFLMGIGTVVALTIAPTPLLRLASAMLSPLPCRFRQLGLRVLSTFVDGLGTLRSGRDTVVVVLLSLLAWTLEAGMYYILMFSFPFSASFLASVLGTAVANLASMVPSSPGYVGTFDFGLSKVMEGTFGVDPSVALAYTGVVHATLLVPVVLLGVFLVWREGLTLKRLASSDKYERGDSIDSATAAEIVPRRTTP